MNRETAALYRAAGWTLAGIPWLVLKAAWWLLLASLWLFPPKDKK